MFISPGYLYVIEAGCQLIRYVSFKPFHFRLLLGGSNRATEGGLGI